MPSDKRIKISRRDFLKSVGVAGLGMSVIATGVPLVAIATETSCSNGSNSGKQSSQKPLPGSAIPRFVDPLPKLDVAGGTIQTIIAGSNQIVLEMKEFKANMLPHTFAAGTYEGTWVWGYLKEGTNTDKARATYTGPVVIATRNVPAEFKFVNNLGSTDTTNALAYVNSIDQSLHWANPNMVDRYVSHSSEPPAWVGNPDHYSGSIPAAVHLHGAEDPAAVDGGPDSWFTSDGQHGPGFYSRDGNKHGNYCIFRYPNVQEAAPIWFHDHTLGATRLNVYCGLAGGYLITDPAMSLPAGLNATGLRGGATGPNPNDDTVISLVVQDRKFDTDGQLYFPASPLDQVSPSTNPEHQWWVPEFFGDTVAVNGKVWPYLEVKAQRYRFLLFNGSNARTYELTFQGNAASPAIWQVGTDQGYLDKPVSIDPLVVMSGERADFIVDFAGLTPGTTLLLNNTGPDEPFNGTIGAQAPADPSTTGVVMQFKVVSGAAAVDTSFDPAASGAVVRNGSATSPLIVRLVNPATGTLAAGVHTDLTRQLTLNEIARGESITVDGVRYNGGPLEILVNNTRWTGRKPDSSPNNMTTDPDQPGFTSDGLNNYLSELPVEGTTEIWEIVNLTMDAHPIHTHLAQFQLMNRQAFSGDPDARTGYYQAYDAAFSGGDIDPEKGTAFPAHVFKPSFGPPLSYSPSSVSGGKYGGNPDIVPYLSGPAAPPNANEAGWKDTVLAPPGMITRFVVRWAPTEVPVNPGNTASLRYAFVPNDDIPGKTGAKFDYVWHCHIIDHEDNEMMRPDMVVPVPNAQRTYRMGVDY